MYTLALVLHQKHQLRLTVAFVKLQAFLLDCLEEFRIKLTIRTKSTVYRAFVCSTLLYGSEIWTLSTIQEKEINTYHLQCFRVIIIIKWLHMITNEEVLRRTGSRWHGHVLRMSDERIPMVLLYSKLVVGKNNTTSRPRKR